MINLVLGRGLLSLSSYWEGKKQLIIEYIINEINDMHNCYIINKKKLCNSSFFFSKSILIVL